MLHEELNDRQKTILHSIIQQFILAAPPVGSRNITEKFYSNYWELKYIYTQIYLKLKMINFAIDNIESCLKLCKDNYSVYKLAGDIYFHANDYKKSEEFYMKCISFEDKNDIDFYLSLADVSLKNKRINQSVNYFDLALKIDSKHNLALKGKSNVLSLLNKK